MIIKNASNGEILASKAWFCKTLEERCRGLMFKKITPDEGCVLVSKSKDVIASSIHMMFVPQNLQVLWLDENMKVITIKNCKKANIFTWWRTYSPSEPAKYVVEVLDAKKTIKGDELRFLNE